MKFFFRDQLAERVREVNEAQQRREAAQQRTIDDAKRRAEASGAAEYVRQIARAADTDGVVGARRDDQGYLPEVADPATVAANGLAWGQVREAGRRLLRDRR